MRPLELTIEGFKSHRDVQTFSFEDRTLFAVVGPTGAGKSSILEAIIFALYGKTPRLERDTKKLIYTGSDDSRVRLVFEVDDHLWEVIRVLRRSKASEVVLRRHGEQSHDASGDRAVNVRVEELLGLDFKAFCSSVMLPQGEFDQFLAATPGDRSKILKGIFRLERVDALRESARDHATELRGKATALEAELVSLSVDPEVLEGLRSDLSAAEERAQTVREAMTEATKAQGELERARESIREIDAHIAEAKAMIDQIPETAALEELSSSEEESRRVMEAAEEKLKEGADRLKKCQSQLAVAEKKTGGAEAVRQARDLARDHTALKNTFDSLRRGLPNLSSALEQAEDSLKKAKHSASSADASLSNARVELDSLRQRHAAHLLRKELVAGEVCPVCDQAVDRIPAAGRAPVLKRAEEAAAKAEAKALAARTALEEGRRDHAVAAERHKSVSRQLKEAEKTLEGAHAALVALIGEVPDPVEEIRHRERLLDEAKMALEVARTELGEAEVVTREAATAADRVAATRRRMAASLISVCGALRIVSPDVESEAVELLDAAKRAADMVASLIQRAQRNRVGVGTTAARYETTLVEFRERFGLSGKAPITLAIEEANATVGSLRKEIEAVEKGIARAKQIEEEVKQVVTRRDLYARLWEDLADTKFVAYLLDGQRRLLSRIGSEKLFELTGRYRFDDEGGFQIIDAATGVGRSSDTLSGGETFLASLALALALAEAVSQEGGRLGCFFLDEGFGSLDPESLNVALEGIEKLATPGRLIGLISHVRDIQHRLDDLIVLDKNEDGTTMVVQTEGPIGYLAANI